MTVNLKTKNGSSVNNVLVADSFLAKFFGLMGKQDISEYGGLILLKCNSIHTFFMRFDIDVFYLSEDLKIIGFQTLKPWRIGKIIRGVSHVLEITSGNNSFKLGDTIIMEETEKR